ncbi:MAG: 2-hydroxychromene-2-carboxylate isomerase [Mycobacteriales bacterium]
MSPAPGPDPGPDALAEELARPPARLRGTQRRRAPREPVFYFSLRSPYSWLAYRDLLDRYPDVAERVRWEPFWEPDEHWRRVLGEAGVRFHYVDMSRAKALYVLQDVRRLARDRGLALTWPVDRAPRWEVAHFAFLRARRQGRGRPFVAAVYRARWEQGRDISDPATVGAIAAEIGLDAAEHAGAVEDPDLRDEALDALRALDADGVFGVPFFVTGRERFWGLDRLAAFAALVRTAEQPATEQPAAEQPSTEQPAADPLAADRAAGDQSMRPAAVQQAGPADLAAGEPVLVPGGDIGHAGGCG